MSRQPYYSSCQGEGLYGWAAIAEYMGATARVVQRWYRKFGLPVARHVGKRVFTTRNAIDTWIKDISLAERRIEVQMKAADEGEAE